MSKNKYGGPERRRYKRIDVNFIVSYRIKREKDNSDLSQTKNVSEGGMLLTTNRKFEKGVRLAMFIRFPFIPQKIEIEGEVIDSKEVVKDVIYETRLRFFGLEEAIARQLGDFVRVQSEK